MVTCKLRVVNQADPTASHIKIRVITGVEEDERGTKRAREGEELTREDVKRMKVGELRAELERRGLDVAWVKETLASRLLAPFPPEPESRAHSIMINTFASGHAGAARHRDGR